MAATLPLATQKKKGAKKGAKEVKKDTFLKLNDDEKNDLVGAEVEMVQAEIDQVRGTSLHD